MANSEILDASCKGVRLLMEKVHSDSVSKISEQLWLDILKSNQDQMPKTKIFDFDFIANREVFEIEVENLINIAS